MNSEPASFSVPATPRSVRADPSIPQDRVRLRVSKPLHLWGTHVDGGFTYLGLMILVAIVAVTATAGIQLGAVVQRRDAEQELLHAGKQLAAALRSYRDSTPVGQPSSPRELKDLLRDPRVPGLRRHLRSVPMDPITGEARWGVERTPDGGIVGVNSLSEAHPIKVGNFEPSFESFAGKEKYSQWVFSASMLGEPTKR